MNRGFDTRTINGSKIIVVHYQDIIYADLRLLFKLYGLTLYKTDDDKPYVDVKQVSSKKTKYSFTVYTEKYQYKCEILLDAKTTTATYKIEATLIVGNHFAGVNEGNCETMPNVLFIPVSFFQEIMAHVERDGSGGAGAALMDKLAKDSTLSVNTARRNSMIIMGQVLLDNGYENAFVAGMLGNIMREGSFGQFEFAGSQPYLQYFINNHNYKSRFSGKEIHNVDVTPQELYNITSSSPNQINIFGLGIAQWTHISRFFPLLNFYIEATGGGQRRITSGEVVEAETRMMIQELSENKDFNTIYSNWKTANNATLNSQDAAYDAASRLCLRYLIPNKAQSKAVQRGNDAKDIYRIMMS